VAEHGHGNLRRDADRVIARVRASCCRPNLR
jgi:hypothetical protein